MKKTRYILLTALILGFGGCKNYFVLDKNPNLITTPSLSALLSTTTQKTGLRSQEVANITSYFVQYLANPGANGATDTYQDTDYSGTWNNLYYAMADIYDLKQIANEQGAEHYLGVADVMLSYHLTLVADMFGDAPYSEAYQRSTLTPRYDSAQTLYDVSLQLLDEAIEQLSIEETDVALAAENDLIHGGDALAWKKTAYALKARLLIKISKQADFDADAVLAAIDSSYESNEDDAKMGAFTLRNPWSQIAISNDNLVLGGWLSSNLVNQMNGETYGVVDPRIAFITEETVNDNYVGTINGQGNVGESNTVRDECYLSLSSPMTSEDSPLIIVSFAELKFIEAEAQFRNGNKPAAYNAYLEGINASMDKLGVPSAAANEYLAEKSVATGASKLTLNEIFKEKYIVTYLNPEAWNDARRHNYEYENFQLPMNAVLDTFIRRTAYPNAERAQNGANVPPVVALSEPLWWDNPI